MKALSFEQLAYEFSEIWEPEWFPADDHERFRTLARMIPADTCTVLDAGCGNGLFLKQLQAEYGNRFARLVGVDRSEAALVHVRTEKTLASLDLLPFADAEFDTVTCNEVIEHLPVPIYEKAISELGRVAKRSIVICVPYRQNLEASLSTCPLCRARFNADFHVRSYNEGTLGRLFDRHGFDLAETRYLSASTIRYDREFRAKLGSMFRRKRDAGYPPYALCPVCGFSDHPKLVEALAQRKQRKAGEAPLKEAVPRFALRSFVASMMPARTAYRWIASTYTRGTRP